MSKYIVKEDGRFVCALLGERQDLEALLNGLNPLGHRELTVHEEPLFTQPQGE
jgi:hypothetical protein